MLILRFRSRRIPTWLGMLWVVTLGLQSSALAILFVREPLSLAADAVGVVILAWFLVRAGRWRTTGVLLIASGLLGALWWGSKTCWIPWTSTSLNCCCGGRPAPC